MFGIVTAFFVGAFSYRIWAGLKRQYREEVITENLKRISRGS